MMACTVPSSCRHPATAPENMISLFNDRRQDIG